MSDTPTPPAESPIYTLTHTATPGEYVLKMRGQSVAVITSVGDAFTAHHIGCFLYGLNGPSARARLAAKLARDRAKKYEEMADAYRDDEDEDEIDLRMATMCEMQAYTCRLMASLIDGGIEL